MSLIRGYYNRLENRMCILIAKIDCNYFYGKFIYVTFFIFNEPISVIRLRVLDSGSGGRISWDWIIFALFMRSKFVKMIRSPDCSIFHEIKIQKSIISEFWSHDQRVNLLIKIVKYYWTNLISWKSWISISWLIIGSPEKVEFWSHEIQPHDHFPCVFPCIKEI